MSLNHDSPGGDPLVPALPDAAEPPLGPYAEADDEATRFVDTPRPDPHWLVQVTLFDRRIMSTEGLLAELRRGRLVLGSTPVWRDGMPNWRDAAHVHELQSAVPFPVLSAPRAALRRRSVTRSGAWLCGAAALLTLSLTLYALASAGVFAASATRPQPTSLTASVQAR